MRMWLLIIVGVILFSSLGFAASPRNICDYEIRENDGKPSLCSPIGIEDCSCPSRYSSNCITKNCPNQIKIGDNHDDDDNDNDGENRYLSSIYSGKQTFGSTDYKDHRNDKLEKLKTYI